MRIILCMMLSVSAACQSGLEVDAEVPELDKAYFDCRVQPVLTKFCSGLACHGNTERYFTVFARNRLRLDQDESKRNGFMSEEERGFNYRSALTVALTMNPDSSLLLLKPLEQEAGGSFHRAASLYSGIDVFANQEDLPYQVLKEWIMGAQEDPTCEEPGSRL